MGRPVAISTSNYHILFMLQAMHYIEEDLESRFAPEVLHSMSGYAVKNYVELNAELQKEGIMDFLDSAISSGDWDRLDKLLFDDEGKIKRAAYTRFLESIIVKVLEPYSNHLPTNDPWVEFAKKYFEKRFYEDRVSRYSYIHMLFMTDVSRAKMNEIRLVAGGYRTYLKLITNKGMTKPAACQAIAEDEAFADWRQESLRQEFNRYDDYFEGMAAEMSKTPITTTVWKSTPIALDLETRAALIEQCSYHVETIHTLFNS